MMAAYLERLPIEVETSARYRVLVGDLSRLFCFDGYGSDPADRFALTIRAIDRARTTLGRPIDPREVIVIGDTPLDVEAGRTAGAISVAVASGRYVRDELEWSGADHILGALGELFAFRGSRDQWGR